MVSRTADREQMVGVVGRRGAARRLLLLTSPSAETWNAGNRGTWVERLTGRRHRGPRTAGAEVQCAGERLVSSFVNAVLKPRSLGRAFKSPGKV